mgnify:CR=1 FL=1
MEAYKKRLVVSRVAGAVKRPRDYIRQKMGPNKKAHASPFSAVTQKTRLLDAVLFEKKPSHGPRVADPKSTREPEKLDLLD